MVHQQRKFIARNLILSIVENCLRSKSFYPINESSTKYSYMPQKFAAIQYVLICTNIHVHYYIHVYNIIHMKSSYIIITKLSIPICELNIILKDRHLTTCYKHAVNKVLN